MDAEFHHPNPPEIHTVEPNRPELMHLPIDQLEADAQIRLDFDDEAIENLALSLKSEGQLVALLAFRDDVRQKFVILDGERRYRAAQRAGLKELKAEVWPFRPSPDEILMMQLSIDQMRENLNPVEQAAAYRKVMEANGWNASELANRIHVAHTTITRATSLLELPDDLQALVRSRELPVALAREVARVTDPELRNRIWAKVKQGDLNARQTQQLVTRVLNATKGKPKRGPKPKARFSYRNVGGYDISGTLMKFTVKSAKKGRSNTDAIAALRVLLERLTNDMIEAETKAEVEPEQVRPAEPAMSA
jgi:ParB family chromosome partitioning protein